MARSVVESDSAWRCGCARARSAAVLISTSSILRLGNEPVVVRSTVLVAPALKVTPSMRARFQLVWRQVGLLAVDGKVVLYSVPLTVTRNAVDPALL